MDAPIPRDTPGLICYRIECRLGGEWYYWGLSPTPTPAIRDCSADDIRGTPVWAKAFTPRLRKYTCDWCYESFYGEQEWETHQDEADCDMLEDED